MKLVLAFGTVLFALFGLAETPVVADGFRRPVHVRFGVLSDTHVSDEASVPRLEAALRRLAAEKVDAVLHCGDVTDLGYTNQLAVFVKTYRRVMGDRPFLSVWGNRDLSDTGKFSPEQREADRDRLILTTGRNPGIRCVAVRGVNVVLSDWKHEGALEDFLSSHPEIRTNVIPPVVVQHCHPLGTVFGASGWMADDGRAGCCLRLFPGSVVFSGHSHRPFSQPHSLWQEGFASVAAGCCYCGPTVAKFGQEVSVLDVSADRSALRRIDLVNGTDDEVALVRPQALPSLPYTDGVLTVVQWNLGHFSFGKSVRSAIPSEAAAERASAYQALLDGLRPDVVGLSEYSPAFASGDADTRTLVLGGYGHFAEGGQEGFQSNALASRSALEHVRVIPFAARRQKTYRLEADAVVLGRKTRLVQTHLDLDAEIRRKQIGELADALAGDDCVLLSGDFNVGSPDEYKPLLDVGFASANPGPCGVWPTHRRRRMELTPAIDNVLVRGFEIADVRTADGGLLLSDHRPLVVRIRKGRR